jgi:guanine nucleotide-binding protein subunit alpha
LQSGETGLEKKARLKAEAEAKRVSDNIDKEIERDRQRRRREAGPKILLLGQAESGKSTVLKNFQICLAPEAFKSERELWRPVIHLNLVRSINFVITFITSTRSVPAREGEPSRPSNSSLITPEIRRLCIRLEPLRQVEDNLISLLSGRAAPPRRRTLSQLKNIVDPEVESLPKATKLPQELVFPSEGRWKEGFSRPARLSLDSQHPGAILSVNQSKDGQSLRILAALGDEIMRLWEDSTVQSLLKSAEIRLDEQPGFFLDQIGRLTQEDYVPPPEDVLKARITTIGPEEHVIVTENGSNSSERWTIYDVGGSQSQRAAWAQFFDDVNVIIFMAPMSGFNQVLAEDQSVNRLTDSLRLWQAICSNKILASIDFVLFLNKLDLLECKLRSGIQFSSFVTSYEGENAKKPVSKYLLDAFVSLHQQFSPKRRNIYPYLTCAVDMKATSSIILGVRELILAKLLTETTFIP